MGVKYLKLLNSGRIDTRIEELLNRSHEAAVYPHMTTQSQTIATGRNAIDLAETDSSVELRKHADPVEGSRIVTIEEARSIAAEDPSLIYATKA